MTINITNRDVEKLLDEITEITGESRTQAVQKALEERRLRLATQTSLGRDDVGLFTFLQQEVWPRIPSEHLGVRLTKEEEEQILGYGEQGA